MKKLLNLSEALSVFLYLMSAHSLIVGAGLIMLPRSVFELLGLNYYPADFFRYQGGVFHIVMSIAYALAAFNVKGRVSLIVFSIAVKLIAAVFLFLYFALSERILIIFLSGAGDLLMGVIVWILLVKSEITDNKLITAE